MPSLLILGGTRFVGHLVAQAAVEAGWTVDLLHRGRAPSPQGVADILIGDRTDPRHLDLFEGRRWDAVVDTWSGHPDAIRASTAACRDRAGCYVYVSSQSVYVWPSPAGADERAPVVPAASAAAQSLDYATSNRMGEIAVLDAFGDRGLVARAGLLLGPREHPSRLPWWLARMARGGDVPVPGPRDFPLQYLDGRDLADWILSALSSGTRGIFNAIGPVAAVTMEEVMAQCRSVTGSSAKLHWIDPSVIEREGVAPWTSLPLWITPGPDHGAAFHRNVDRIAATGLKLRSLRETVRAAWEWTQGTEGRDVLSKARVGMTAEEERRLLAGA